MSRANCTDASWPGRADCRHCVVRQLINTSVLEEDVFTKALQPIVNAIYSKHSILFSQGQRGEYLYLIRSGLVKLIIGDADGVERIVRLMGSGSVLGMELLLPDHGHYNHKAMAHGEVDLCRISLRSMRELVGQHPALYPPLLQRSADHIRLAEEVIVSFTSGHVDTRVENVLAFLTRDTGNKDGRFFKMSGVDMASLVGATEESVSRVLAKLKRQGRLQCTGGYCIFV